MTGLEWAIQLGLSLDPSDGIPEPKPDGLALWYDAGRSALLVSAATKLACLAHVMDHPHRAMVLTAGVHRGIITTPEAHAWWGACAGGAVLAVVYRVRDGRPTVLGLAGHAYHRSR